MLRRAVEATPGCDGLILGGHGLFTWGETQRECYLNSITHHRLRWASSSRSTRDARRQAARSAAPTSRRSSRDREGTVTAILPYLRGVVSSNRRVIAHFDASEDALDVRELEVGGGSVPHGHELPRSLPAHAHLADVRAVGSGAAGRGAARTRIGERVAEVPRRLRRVLQRVRRQRPRRRCAMRTRRSSSFRASGCSASARTSARRGSRRSSSSTRFT